MQQLTELRPESLTDAGHKAEISRQIIHTF